MRHAVTDGQRRPVLFGLALSIVSVLGLVVMLADGGAWTGLGFVGALLPGVLALTGHLRHRP